MAKCQRLLWLCGHFCLIKAILMNSKIELRIIKFILGVDPRKDGTLVDNWKGGGADGFLPLVAKMPTVIMALWPFLPHGGYLKEFKNRIKNHKIKFILCFDPMWDLTLVCYWRGEPMASFLWCLCEGCVVLNGREGRMKSIPPRRPEGPINHCRFGRQSWCSLSCVGGIWSLRPSHSRDYPVWYGMGERGGWKSICLIVLRCQASRHQGVRVDYVGIPT